MERIEDCLCFLFGKAYQRINQEAKRRLASYGVTPVQYAVLKVLWEQDDQSGAELGERLQLDSASITGVIDRLEHAGLVARQLDPRDRRINRVVLTARGRDLQAPLDRAMDETNLSFVESLPSEDAERLEALLKTLTGVAIH